MILSSNSPCVSIALYYLHCITCCIHYIWFPTLYHIIVSITFDSITFDSTTLYHIIWFPTLHCIIYIWFPPCGYNLHCIHCCIHYIWLSTLDIHCCIHIIVSIALDYLHCIPLQYSLHWILYIVSHNWIPYIGYPLLYPHNCIPYIVLSTLDYLHCIIYIVLSTLDIPCIVSLAVFPTLYYLHLIPSLWISIAVSHNCIHYIWFPYIVSPTLYYLHWISLALYPLLYSHNCIHYIGLSTFDYLHRIHYIGFPPCGYPLQYSLTFDYLHRIPCSIHTIVFPTFDYLHCIILKLSLWISLAVSPTLYRTIVFSTLYPLHLIIYIWLSTFDSLHWILYIVSITLDSLHWILHRVFLNLGLSTPAAARTIKPVYHPNLPCTPAPRRYHYVFVQFIILNHAPHIQVI
jgi:hypothetical protein